MNYVLIKVEKKFFEDNPTCRGCLFVKVDPSSGYGCCSLEKIND